MLFSMPDPNHRLDDLPSREPMRPQRRPRRMRATGSIVGGSGQGKTSEARALAAAHALLAMGRGGLPGQGKGSTGPVLAFGLPLGGGR